MFWSRRTEFQLGSSELLCREVQRTPDPQRRQAMLESLHEMELFGLTAEMRELAERYIAGGAFTDRMGEDALHVAAAVVAGYDLLVSWNFRHLVNRRRKASVNAVNVASGLPTVEIVAPPEI